MNGVASKMPNGIGQTDCAPAYSLLRDVNGLEALRKNQNSVGRYTVLSKSVTKKNGNESGVYEPSTNFNQFSTLDSSKRAQSHHTFDRHGSMNSSQTLRNGYFHQNGNNTHSSKSGVDNTTFKGAETHALNKFTDTKHYKSHLVSSTFVLRDTGNRSAGGSQSCGQASPSSATEDSTISAFSPNSVRTTEATRPQHQSLWLHQSEIVLPTGRDFDSARNANRGGEKRTISVAELQTDRSLGSLSSIDQHEKYYTLNSNSMLYASTASRNNSEEYMNSYPSGPSHRKIQNIQGSGAAQRRYPSDTTLNYPQREGSQIYTSGNKPGPVTIPARSRSAQPSPGPSPLASPTGLYRVSDQDQRNRVTRSQQYIDLQYSPAPRGRSSPPILTRPQFSTFAVNGGSEDDVESPILPSVREIIRQVEEMTRSNAATSTTDITVAGTSPGQSSIPRYQRNLTSRGPEHLTRAGILRQPGSSQRTPSAPQLRSTQYTPMQAKFNSIMATQSRNVAPPVPPHGTTKSKAIIGAFTRRTDPTQQDSSIHPQRFEVTANPVSAKKTELLSHLPMDYQKLREAFIEQRREIQRLRKQLAEKDMLINQLQGDIRLYEPWR